jgi:hypothetical protein
MKISERICDIKAELVPAVAGVQAGIHATKNEVLPLLSSTELVRLALCHLLEDLRIEGEYETHNHV